MVLENLSESFRNTLQKIAKSLFVDEKLINELIKDIQRALLQSDVNVVLVYELTKRIKERALKEDVKGLSKKEQLINIVYDELVIFLGGESEHIEILSKPHIIMLVGLFGSGKTTTAAKLAKFYTKRGFKACLLGLDVYRPAASNQLEQVGEYAKVPVFIDNKEKNPLKIYWEFEKELHKFDIVIVDTAGRDALSSDLISEINDLHKAIKPQENLLVISADIGQSAERQAKAFHEACAITGVIVTKLEGTAKGGGALTACAATGSHIKFIGIGEKVDDFEQFSPKGFVSRLLGMGDLEALIDKASQAITQEEAKDMGKKFLKGEFNLIDLYEQMEAMKKMGPLSKVMDMIPGFSQVKMPKELLQTQEQNLKKWRFVLDSMTKKELEDPEIIDSSRIERIASGSGTSVKEIRELLKQYKQSKKVMKMMKGNGKNLSKMMKKFGGNIPPDMKF